LQKGNGSAPILAVQNRLRDILRRLSEALAGIASAEIPLQGSDISKPALPALGSAGDIPRVQGTRSSGIGGKDIAAWQGGRDCRFGSDRPGSKARLPLAWQATMPSGARGPYRCGAQRRHAPGIGPPVTKDLLFYEEFAISFRASALKIRR
jgi:hypothetical protein